MKTNFDAFLSCVDDIMNGLDIVVLGEVNIKEEEKNSFSIQGYDMYVSCRANRRGGGVIVYIKSVYDFCQMQTDFNFCEGVWGIISLNGYKTHLLALYRPPNNAEQVQFIDEIDVIIGNIAIKQQIIMIGDINININHDENLNVQRYKNMMSFRGMRRCIFGHTRVEFKMGIVSKTCIDHIFVRLNNREHDIVSVILEAKISDHYAIAIGINVTDNNGTEVSDAKQRIVMNENKLKSLLVNVDWDQLLELSDPCEMYDRICNEFSKAYEASEEMKEEGMASKRNSKPWLTVEIRTLIKDRDRIFKKWKNCKNNMEYRNIYKKLRNNINKLIRKAKLLYTKKRFEDCQQNIRKTWREINTVIGKPPKNSVDDVLRKHMLKHVGPAEIVNSFAHTFLEQVRLIKHDCTIKTISNCEFSANQSMLLKNTTPESISKVIKTSRVDKSSGIDKIRMKDLQIIVTQISPIISKLINLCFKLGIIPSMLKHSIIRPVYKSGDHSLFINYRPIAILSEIEILMEGHAAEQLINYLNAFGIISPKQYGFQKNKSTGMLLNDFSDFIYDSLNKGLEVVAVFIDFSKAFDTLLHTRLLGALERAGIRGPLLAWFRNYLENRFITVKFERTFSIPKLVTSGVPQGSKLGPLLYLVYVNDMMSQIKKSNIYLYADDTALVAVHKDFKKANQNLQSDFSNILRWSHDNGLTLNYKKTKAMHIHSPFKRLEKVRLIYHDYGCLHRNSRTHVDYSDSRCECIIKIDNTFEHTYLGVIIDNTFKWDKHIDKITKKLRSGLYSLRLLEPYVNFSILKTVYFAIVESVLRYGILAWGCTTNEYILKITTLQNKIFKTIMRKNKNNQNQHQFMTIRQLHRFIFITTNYFKADHKLLPQHKYETRNIDKYTAPQDIYNNYGKQARCYLIPNIFNKIPTEYKTFTKMSDVKKVVKLYVYDNI
jgi:hypothetical protein